MIGPGSRRTAAGTLALALLATLLDCKARPHEPGYPHVGVTQDRLTLAKDDGGSLASFERAASPVVTYRVTLNGAPVGERLPVACSWTDPQGRVVHQNAFRTQRIATPVWETHCKCLLGPAAAPGTWKVQMDLDGRLLRSASFELK